MNKLNKVSQLFAKRSFGTTQSAAYKPLYPSSQIMTPQGAQTSFKLASGDEMPAVGLGLWKVPKDITAETTLMALKNGYRLLDQAACYGNEKETGDGIKMALDQGVVDRKDLFVTGKLWNNYHKKEHVKVAFMRSLEDLQCDYIDMFQIHFPVATEFVPFEHRYPPGWTHDPTIAVPKVHEIAVPMQETWEAMQELVKEGLVRNLGLANCNAQLIRDLCSYAEIKPAVLQTELHPYNTKDRLIRFCKERDIHVTAYSSFGAASYIEMGRTSKNDCAMFEPIVEEIAKAHGKHPAQILLKWAVQRGTAVIPKTIYQNEQIANIDIFDFELTEDDMSKISGLNRDHRFNDTANFVLNDFNTFVPIHD